MKNLVINSLLATTLAATLAASVPAMAQYVGPDSSPKSIKELDTSLLGHDQLVTLKGHITRRVADELYEFSDGSGTVYLDIDKKFWRWPANTPIDQKTTIEVHGKFVNKAFHFNKIKVIDLRIASK